MCLQVTTEPICGPPRAIPTALEAVDFGRRDCSCCVTRSTPTSGVWHVLPATSPETNEHIRQRLHLPDPPQYFQGRWTSAFDKFESNCSSLEPNDFLHKIPIQRIRSRILKLFQADEQPRPADVPATSDEVFHSCAYRSYTAETAELLKRHLSKKRKAHPLYSRFEPLRDAKEGKPQCTHCHSKLANWKGLMHHISYNNCPNFDESRPMQVPPGDHEELRQYIATHAWEPLFERPELATMVRDQCVLCARAFGSGKDILTHLARCHHTQWQESKSDVARIMTEICTTKACLACGKDKQPRIALMQRGNLLLCYDFWISDNTRLIFFRMPLPVWRRSNLIRIVLSLLKSRGKEQDISLTRSMNFNRQGTRLMALQHAVTV